jgi:hypothetical protein
MFTDVSEVTAAFIRRAYWPDDAGSQTIWYNDPKDSRRLHNPITERCVMQLIKRMWRNEEIYLGLRCDMFLSFMAFTHLRTARPYVRMAHLLLTLSIAQH